MEGRTENPGEKEDDIVEDISNDLCPLTSVIGTDGAVWKAGVPVPDALDITREWLAGLDQSEDGIEVDPQVLDGLEEKALAMRRELKGEICLFSVVVVPIFSFLVCVQFPLLGCKDLFLLARDLGIEEEIKDREFRINDQFTNLRKHGYRIHSVFIHRGKHKVSRTI